MASGAILLQWRDRNWAEHGHYIYRSDTPMNPNNLPSPIGSVEQNITEYIDYDVIEGEAYYYRIAAYRNNDIMVSDEIQLVAEPLDTGHGPVDFIGGDLSHGFFGEVSANDFITGNELASRIGLTAGTTLYSDTEWLKFSLNDEIIFVPKKPIRYGMSWDHIYSRGAVYGTGDNGLYPTGSPTTQDATVEIDGYTYQVRLLKGANADQGNLTGSGSGFDVDWTHGSEWNLLMYPIHSGVHTDNRNPSTPSEPYNQWASYSDSDLLLVHSSFGNGTHSWCQERSASYTVSRVLRGSIGVSLADWLPSGNTSSPRGWRPALVLVK